MEELVLLLEVEVMEVEAVLVEEDHQVEEEDKKIHKHLYFGKSIIV
jgi:hypothetical protein